MEIIAKISKGSKMDQIYIPKARAGLETGCYVIIKPIGTKAEKIEVVKPYYYNVYSIEPIKLIIINQIFKIIESQQEVQNIIITGSFLERGFKFNDIDIIIVNKKKLDLKQIEASIKSRIGISLHIIILSNNNLINGLKTDPLYQLMLSKCISKKRLIYKITNKPDYKILDLHLLKSEPLLYNFDILTGEQKYYLTRNLVAIKLFLDNKKLTPRIVNDKIMRVFKIKISNIKDNMTKKNNFIITYRKFYKDTQRSIFKLAENATKQK